MNYQNNVVNKDIKSFIVKTNTIIFTVKGYIKNDRIYKPDGTSIHITKNIKIVSSGEDDL